MPMPARTSGSDLEGAVEAGPEAGAVAIGIADETVRRNGVSRDVNPGSQVGGGLEHADGVARRAHLKTASAIREAGAQPEPAVGLRDRQRRGGRIDDDS